MKTKARNTHKTVALRPPGVLVSYHDGLEDLAELLEVAAHRLALGLPRQPSNEDLRVGRVPEGGIQEVVPGARARRRPRARVVKSHGIQTRRGLTENPEGESGSKTGIIKKDKVIP